MLGMSVLEDTTDWHKVIPKRVKKGNLMVDKIRQSRKEQGWIVDHRDPKANGVDLVATKDGWYEVYEITNWNKNGFILEPRLDCMINNLNSEERTILSQHPDASLVKIILFNYRENLRKLGFEEVMEKTRNNNIWIAFSCEIELEDDEEAIMGG